MEFSWGFLCWERLIYKRRGDQVKVLWVMILEWKKLKRRKMFHVVAYIAHLRQQCHNSKFVIFQEKDLKVLKCYNFLWVQIRHNCSPAASVANCVMTLYLLKVHLQTFISIPIAQKCQILNRDSLVANEPYTRKGSNNVRFLPLKYLQWIANFANHPVENLSILFNYTL